MDQDREERIRTRAYEIWEREGGHESHWNQAEQELGGEEPGERGQTAVGGESDTDIGGTTAAGASRKKT